MSLLGLASNRCPAQPTQAEQEQPRQEPDAPQPDELPEEGPAIEPVDPLGVDGVSIPEADPEDEPSQQEQEQEQERPKPPLLRQTLSIRALHTFSADLDGIDDADVAVDRIGVKVNQPLFFERSLRLAVSAQLDVEGSQYDFDGLEPRLGGDPVDEALRVSLGPRVMYFLDDRWTLFGNVNLAFSGEPEADVDQSLVVQGFAGANYALNENLSLTLGLAGASRLEEDPLVFPILGISWQISPTLKLSTDGPGVRLTKAVSDPVSLYIAGGFDSRDFRLDEDGALPDGVLRDSRFPVSLGVRVEPDDRYRFDFRVGAVIWHEYEFEDRQGFDRFEESADPAVVVSVRGQIVF